MPGEGKSISQNIAYPELPIVFLHVGDLWHIQDKISWYAYNTYCNRRNTSIDIMNLGSHLKFQGLLLFLVADITLLTFKIQVQ